MKEKSKEQSKCTHCGFTQSDNKWKSEANFEYNGKYVGNRVIPGIYPPGDHARCPSCNKLVHIDYDLDEVK